MDMFDGHHSMNVCDAFKEQVEAYTEEHGDSPLGPEYIFMRL